VAQNDAFSCVDVVIPTWNRGDLLYRAVQSALDQGLAVRQVVVVDNGTCRASLDRIADDRIRIVQTQPSIGASAARNVGAESASADLIAFLDDDDYWQRGFLESSLPLFDQGADIVVGRLMRKGEGAEPQDYKLLDDSGAGLRRLYFSNPGFGGQNIIVRRELFLKLGGFDSDMPASNDRDFAVRALQAGAVIRCQPLSVAVLCDHAGARVRHNQLAGNYRFLKKHWRHMSWNERLRALRTLARRFVKFRLGR
jgi:glycosyltransferase involved in cell wall biosynthesis